MRAALVFGLLALAVWVGVEVQTHGIEGAFDGLLAPVEAPEHRTTAQRAGESVQQAHDASQERLERQLEQIE
jgi:hypothetical protein